MEDIELVSIALDLTLSEILEVETSVLSVVNMESEPTCSKNLVNVCASTSKPDGEESNDDDDTALDETDKKDKVNSKESGEESKKRKKGEKETSKQEKKRSHKKKKGGDQSKVKPEKPEKKDTNDDDAEGEENSSDEEVNKLNEVAKQMSEFRSIKDLPLKKMHRVLKFEIVETVNGRTVRLQLEDLSLDEGFFFVHLPRRFLPAVEANFSKYANITKSKKPFYFAFMGQKGRTFKVLFTRNPDKAV